jgi:hypothetical protein
LPHQFLAGLQKGQDRRRDARERMGGRGHSFARVDGRAAGQMEIAWYHVGSVSWQGVDPKPIRRERLLDLWRPLRGAAAHGSKADSDKPSIGVFMSSRRLSRFLYVADKLA